MSRKVTKSHAHAVIHREFAFRSDDFRALLLNPVQFSTYNPFIIAKIIFKAMLTLYTFFIS
jgi:hypothetical protein